MVTWSKQWRRVWWRSGSATFSGADRCRAHHCQRREQVHTSPSSWLACWTREQQQVMVPCVNTNKSASSWGGALSLSSTFSAANETELPGCRTLFWNCPRHLYLSASSLQELGLIWWHWVNGANTTFALDSAMQCTRRYSILDLKVEFCCLCKKVKTFPVQWCIMAWWKSPGTISELIRAH